METETPAPAKGRRKKLTRVMQKKKSAASLNTSASVAYYKKVKAALNASLNTSKASVTLKANNKALAQSLQHVKQELRFALNDNGHLRVENQELLIKLRRVENLANVGDQQVYNEKLQKLKGVFSNMSHYLLELGNCVGDGIDLCASPRSSSCSRPQSMEEFRNTQQKDVEGESSAIVSTPTESSSLDTVRSGAVAGGVGTELCPHPSGILDGVSKAKSALDMSIIMEQSLLDVDDGVASADVHMDTVLEEPCDGSAANVKKLSVLTKLPQRVRNVSIKKSSSSGSDDDEGSSKKVAGQKESLTKKTKVQEKDTSCEKLPAPVGRRETFVVSKVTERSLSTSGSVEDITSISMPDLVSGSPMKDDDAPEVFDDQPEAPAPTSPEQIKETANTEASKPQKSTADVVEDTASESKNKKKKKEPEKMTEESKSTKKSAKGSSWSNQEKRKSGGKKTASTAAKNAKVTSAPVSQKEAEFFISNPCALNLVHKRVTGSSEGCSEPPAVAEAPEASPAVESFMAEIRESNRKSNKTVASFIVADEASSIEKRRKSAEQLVSTQKTTQAAEATVETEAGEDQTMFFDSDMEFTSVLPEAEANPLQAVDEQQEPAEPDTTKVTAKRASARSKAKAEKENVDAKKPVRSKSASRVNAENPDAKDKEADGVSGDEKKLAVALRVNKPGQMVFAVARKEEDGSRKAIPAKMQTKARSKSKKQVEEMLKNLPQKEPEDIFDFHDKTPSHAATESKTQGSVFDLSLNDTLPGVTSTLASFKQRLNVVGEGKQAASSLLGAAPVYNIPLKDDASDQPHSPAQPKGSSSKGRQSRSKSRTRKDDEESSEQMTTDPPKSRGRSRSRKRSETEEDSSATGQSESSAGSGVPSHANSQDDNQEGLRRSARSKSSGRKTYKDDFDDSSLAEIEAKQEPIRGRSRSRVKKGDDDEEDDEEYRPSRLADDAHTRGRSRKRKGDSGEKNSEQSDKPAPSRTRSRSRRRPQEDEISQDKADKTADILEDGHSCAQEGNVEMIDNHQESDAVAIKEDTSSSDSDAVIPLKMITERRHRSRSTHSKKLYSESDSDPFNLDDVPQDSYAAVQVNVEDIVPAATQTKARTRTRTRTRSKGIVLRKTQEEQEKESMETDSHSQAISEPASEKRNSLHDASESCSAERECSPSKRRRTEEGKSIPNSPASKEAVNGAGDRDITPGRKRKSGLPVVDGSKLVHSPSPSQPAARSKKASRLPEPKSAEKNQYQQQLEEVKKRLKAFDNPSSTPSKRSTSQSQLPTKKSRPLVLPTSQPAPARSGSKKSSGKVPVTQDTGILRSKTPTQHAGIPRSKTPTQDAGISRSKTPTQDTGIPRSKTPTKDTGIPRSKTPSAGQDKKPGKSQPNSPSTSRHSTTINPSPVHRTSTSSSLASPRLSSTSSRPPSGDFGDGGQGEGRRVRRAAGAVCYKEPSLHVKLRRGDPNTTFLHKEEAVHIYKSPKGKRGKSIGLDRSALHDLTNQSIAESAVE